MAPRKTVRIGTLILLSGKMGAGKSTRSKELSDDRNAVLISEDAWLAALYPNQITAFEDYLRYSALLKPLLRAHVVDLLRAGVDVVMDFPANTVKQRRWFKTILADAGAENLLVYLKVSDALCLNQIEKRRVENPERAAFDTESMFHEVTRYFQEPEPSEGFTIRVERREE